MTKRFTYLDASRNKYIGSFFRNGNPLTNEEVVDLLNELSDENDQLKCIIKQLEQKYEDKGFSLAYDMKECER